jgi:hypothetical protein
MIRRAIHGFVGPTILTLAALVELAYGIRRLTIGRPLAGIVDLLAALVFGAVAVAWIVREVRR